MGCVHRKLRLHYTVGNDLNLWWCSKIRKWIPIDAKPEGLEVRDKRFFQTKRRAFSHANGAGNGFYVSQFDPHCGSKRENGKGTWLVRTWDVIKEP